MKLKGIELKGTYKVVFSDKYFEVYNDKGEPFYYEDNDGYLSVKEYDEINNQLYYENSNECTVAERVKELTIKEIEKLLENKIKKGGKKMQRFKRIQNQVLDIVEENIKLQEKVNILESTKEGKEVSKEYEALLYIAGLEVKKVFRSKVKYSYRIQDLITYDENGVSIDFRKWVEKVVEDIKDGIIQPLRYNFSTQEIIEFCIKLGVEEVYNSEVEKAKMEYVRSHKGEIKWN